MLRLRTHFGRERAVRYLDLLAVALKPKGYRFVRLYRPEEFPVSLPLLWVYAAGPDSHVGIVVSARAVAGGLWAYHEAQRGRFGYLSPCGDVKAAADQTDSLLKHKMYPGNAW
ncbi:hypothetical protein [Actinomadura sp. GTD37]|uniref:hypothetical protein n=1 Tax=Actinomadura sp. GTD37 TaxID=1778030 RepID=UPI0035BFC7DF